MPHFIPLFCLPAPLHSSSLCLFAFFLIVLMSHQNNLLFSCYEVCLPLVMICIDSDLSLNYWPFVHGLVSVRHLPGLVLVLVMISTRSWPVLFLNLRVEVLTTACLTVLLIWRHEKKHQQIKTIIYNDTIVNNIKTYSTDFFCVCMFMLLKLPINGLHLLNIIINKYN